MHNTSTMYLIYQNSEGQQFSQHWEDLTEMGTLIDPETGEDLELIGWHSQPPAEAQPVAWQFQDRDGKWHVFMDEQHRQNTIADGSWPIRALYAAPPSAPVGVDANELTGVRARLKSGDYDGADVMRAWLAIDKLLALAQQPGGSDNDR